MVNPLDRKGKEAILQAIGEAERSTSGEIRVHVRPRCRKEPMAEARRIFQKLRMHRTREHNAVLVFVAYESRVFAVVGDDGIHQKVGEGFWDSLGDVMKARFVSNDIAGGIVEAVRGVGEKLRQSYPANRRDINELPDAIHEVRQ